MNGPLEVKTELNLSSEKHKKIIIQFQFQTQRIVLLKNVTYCLKEASFTGNNLQYVLTSESLTGCHIETPSSSTHAPESEKFGKFDPNVIGLHPSVFTLP